MYIAINISHPDSKGVCRGSKFIKNDMAIGSTKCLRKAINQKYLAPICWLKTDPSLLIVITSDPS